MATSQIEEGKTAYWTVTKEGYVPKVGSNIITEDLTKSVTLSQENLITGVYSKDEVLIDPRTLSIPAGSDKTFYLAYLRNIRISGDLKFPLINESQRPS